MQERKIFGASAEQLTRGDALLESWMKINYQSTAVLTVGAVRRWSSWSWRQWRRQGHKTSAGRQNWFHIMLPLKARELIRASQTSVTICTKCKKKIIWRVEQQAGMAEGQLAETGNSWFNSNTKRKQTGNGRRNGLPRRNREILPRHASTEWGRSKTGWNQQPQPAWREMLTGDKGNKVFPMQVVRLWKRLSRALIYPCSMGVSKPWLHEALISLVQSDS